MPSYQRLGEVPAKRHTQFRAPSGALYAEEVVGTEGFSGPYSILYHRGLPPPAVEHPSLPRGTIQPLRLAGPQGPLLSVAATGATALPHRYRTAVGPLLEHAPHSERDFRPPPRPPPAAPDGGPFAIAVK